MQCSYHPELLIDQPLGQHHCPECGMMVIAGMGHPLLVYFRDGDDITDDMVEVMGTSRETGWFFLTTIFDEGGPFNTYEEACTAYLEDREELLGK